jgi:CubicO group peptidase (beta-lactamase class C family)
MVAIFQILVGCGTLFGCGPGTEELKAVEYTPLRENDWKVSMPSNKDPVDQLSSRMSVTKSYTSALAGIALDRGRLASLDQKMMDFFPEYADRITDPRKNRITILELLQMRAGYPWEGRAPP